MPATSSAQNLRLLGKNFQTQERYLSNLQGRIDAVKLAITERSKEGRPDASTYRQEELARLQQLYDTELENYQNRRSQLTPEQFRQAKLAAPKQLFEPGAPQPTPNSGISYSQPNSISGGGIVTTTGTATGATVGYRNPNGTFFGTQQPGVSTITYRPINNQGFQPGSILLTQQGPGNAPDALSSIKTQYGNTPKDFLPRITTPLKIETTIQEQNDLRGYSGEIGRIFSSGSGVSLGSEFLSQASKTQKIPDYFFVDQQTAHDFRVRSQGQQEGVTGFLVNNFGLTGHPIEDLSFGYNTLKNRVFVNNWAVKDVENFFRNVGINNENIIDKQRSIDKNTFAGYDTGFDLRTPFAKLGLVLPSRFIAGNIKDVRQTPETIPLSYSVGKVFGLGSEAAQYLAGRAAATSVTEPFLVRTSYAGINKGLQLAPYAIGGLFLAQQGKEVNAISGFGNRSEYVGQQIPGILAFGAGEVSSRGQATQGLLKGYNFLTNAKELPTVKIAEPEVIRYYEHPDEYELFGTSLRADYYRPINTEPLGKKFSISTPAGNLQANKAAFETATYLRPSYNQKITTIPVPTLLDNVGSLEVPKNFDIVSITKELTGKTKNYDVVTATQAMFPTSTAAARGTSAQAGIYVAPTGQAQLFFLGLGKATDYEPGFGLGISEPNLVRIKNLKAYSEELIPIFKKEGQGNRELSDEYLRLFSKPKTAYLETRTYFGETPEVQAIIPQGTPLKQRGLKKGLQEFFGYRNYITLDLPEKGRTIIPVRTYTAGTIKQIPPAPGTTGPLAFFKQLASDRKGSLRGSSPYFRLSNEQLAEPLRVTKIKVPTNTNVIGDLAESSASYMKYLRRVNPATALIGLGTSEASTANNKVLFQVSSRAKNNNNISSSFSKEIERINSSISPSTSRQSYASKISKSSTSSKASRTSQRYSQDYSFSSIASNLSRESGASNTSSGATSKSNSSTKSSSTNYSQGRAPFQPRPIDLPNFKFQTPKTKTRSNIKIKKIKEDFLYTPTLAGLFVLPSKRSLSPFTFGLNVRPLEVSNLNRQALAFLGG